MARIACRSYRRTDRVCADGFIQRPACYGASCVTCGRPSAHLPYCLMDELPATFVDEAGRPRFKQPGQAQTR